MIISETYLDALKEVINIGVGRGASVLNQLLDAHIILEVPEVKIINISELAENFKPHDNQKYAFISLPYEGNISGRAKLIFPFSSAVKLASVFAEKENTDLNEDLNYIRSGILSEVGNIVINSIIGTLSNELKLNLTYKIPIYMEGEMSAMLKSIENTSKEIILCHTYFKTPKMNITGELVLFFEFGSLDKLMHLLNNYING